MKRRARENTAQGANRQWGLLNRVSAVLPRSSVPEGQEVRIKGEVIWVREGKALLARVRTEDSIIEVRIFRPTGFHRQHLVRGAEISLMGRLSRWQGRLCLVHPRIVLRRRRHDDLPQQGEQV